ncbi:hypothetical protein F1559_000902 [Cyanidiococcus yangmingshanensis]|uniref:Globin domain-containing protein n=1 Tax=Cyanidiococcus yangmingshanensis TaxID=2690220 RepID=A0A7J7ICB9_9RHOD|nr:hypothetical protein F1559_000902 [Cyanidiococcus yangmingshanensis]
MFAYSAPVARTGIRPATSTLCATRPRARRQQISRRFQKSALLAVYHMPRKESIETVQATWARAVQQRERIGELFYERLFTLYPELQSMFRSDPAVQRQRLVDMVDAGVNLLNSRSDLEKALRDLGKRHVKYGTQEEQYPIVGANLLQVLETMLGEEHFTDSERGAWQDVYEYWASVMLDGARTVM